MMRFEWKMKSPRSVFLSRILLLSDPSPGCESSGEHIQVGGQVVEGGQGTHVSRAMSWGVWGRTVTFLVVGSLETVALGFCDSGR